MNAEAILHIRHRPASLSPSICALFVLLALVVLPATLLTDPAEEPPTSVIALPRPNSGTFSFAQAEARKSEILSNAPSQRLENWKNPYTGFCIHIAKDDSITVYNHSLKGLFDYNKPRPNQSVGEIKKLVDELPLFGNPAGVLITSEAPLRNSKTIDKVLKFLFVPRVQLFYVQSNKREPTI